MSRMMDADKFLSWLSEVEGEIRKEKMKDCQPDRYDDGLMAATGTVREYVEKMCKIDEAEGKANQSWIPCSERLPDKYMECLVTVNKKHPTHGFTDVFVVEDTYFECEGEFDWQSKFEGMDWNIVAWMELPKPFKEDEISVCEKEACQYYDEFSDGVDKAN